MGHGGSRQGAGRKAGIPNRRSRVLADRAEAGGLAPFDMLTKLSRRLFYMAMRTNDLQAAELAVKAVAALVPYTEARLSPIARTVDIGELTGTLSDQGRQVLKALGERRVSPDEAGRMMDAIAGQARVIEVSELEGRVADLERNAAREQARLREDELQRKGV